MNAAYDAYMSSEEWEELKRTHPERRGGCVACRYAHNLRLHHMFYPKDIRDTKHEHCCWLCDGCHAAFHRAVTGERKKYQPWATDINRTVMLIQAQRREEEYLSMGEIVMQFMGMPR